MFLFSPSSHKGTESPIAEVDLSLKVIVSGMGVLSSLGQGISNFTKALLEGQSGITTSSRFPELSFPLAAAELKNFNFNSALFPLQDLPSTLFATAQKIGRRAPFSVQTSIIAALEAWTEARLHQRPKDNSRIGLIVAGQNTTQGYSYNLHPAFQKNPYYFSPSYALQFMDTNQVGVLSELFNIEGEGFTVGGASASGNIALMQGYRLIQQGVVDICMVVGSVADLSPLELQGFCNIGALTSSGPFHEEPERTCRPFDRDHSGFVWGQASGCLILESRKAENEQIPSYGKIAGAAMTLDANHSSKPNRYGQERAMRQALERASRKPCDIQYINAHGSSSPLGDETELLAIRDVFEEHLSNIWINSTKNMVGHCLWSAGIIEAIATLIQMKEGFIHPNINLDHPIDDKCRFAGKQKEIVTINAAMSNSFGFGGINSSLVFTRGKN